MKNFLILLPAILVSFSVFSAEELDYRDVGEFSPTDYLMGSHGERRDPVFDVYRTVDLTVDLGLTADCGRISVGKTLRGALKNVLDTKYLGDMGRDIVAASPLLLASYWSPTWASVLRHSRLQSNFMAQLRMDQCRAIDSYVDSKVSEFQEQRATCVAEANKRSDGNFEESMDACKNYWELDMDDWSGGGGKTPENRLIESTAKWAGFKGKEADRVINLTKAFIGDTVINRGNVSLDFGPNRFQMTPRTYLMKLKNDTYTRLCDGLIRRVVERGGHKSNVYGIVSDADLKAVSNSEEKQLIDRQTILSLSYLPHTKREIACRKLSESLAMTIFSDDMGKTIDFASSKITKNVHLPNKRKQQAINQTRVLKDQVEMTLALEKKNSDPLNQILYQINQEGEKYQHAIVGEELQLDRNKKISQSLDYTFFDCADGIGCQRDF